MALNDDYLSCKSYEGKEADSVNKGFTLFQDTKSEKYYFAYVGNSNKVLLRSEGYVDIISRNKGIASVIKNKSEVKRFDIIEEGGKFYVILKAANHKEIGRSCDYKTKAAAEKGIEAFGETKTVKAITSKAEVKKTDIKTAKKETSLVSAAPLAAAKPSKVVKEKTIKTKAETKPKTEVKEVVSVVNVETSSQKVTAKPTKASAIVSPVSSEKILDSLHDFLEINEYLDRPRIWDSYGITGYVKFQGEDGRHYFGVYNPDATLYLRSLGFNSEEDRDSSFDLMDSIILLEENYKIENLNGRYYAVLFEENDIVAISPDFSSFIEAFVTTPGGRPREVSGTMF